MSIINERIKEMRLLRGYTLAYVAEQLGIQEATMQRYESGKIKNISHETISKLSQILSCSPTYLMGWSDEIMSESANKGRTVAEAYKDKDALRLLEYYLRLSEPNKKMALGAIEALLNTQGEE